MKNLLNLIVTKIRWWTVFYFLLVLASLALVISIIINDFNYLVYSLSNFVILVSFLFCDILFSEWKASRDRKERRSYMKIND